MLQLRPVVSPVQSQALHGQPRCGRERPALVGRHSPPRAPVQDGLGRVGHHVRDGSKAPGPLNGPVEIEFGKHHGASLHAPFSLSQHRVVSFSTSIVHTAFMGRPWKQFDDELKRRDLGLQWLADRMDCSIQRVQNWTTRGVPRGAFPELAAAFEESIDWVAGLAEPKWKQAAPSPTLSKEALQVAQAYEKMTPRERLKLDHLMAVALDIDAGEINLRERNLESGLGDLEEETG